jgi:succinate-semialdehyde dehydrogenase/glutarate-semialdehyde dehydrogenase
MDHTTIPSAHESLKNARLPDLSRLIQLVRCGEGEREQTTVRMPFTGEILGRVPVCTAEDVRLAIERARRVQPIWARTSLAERRAIFMRYHDLLLAHRQELLDLLQLEAGKARLDALDEVFDVAINSRHYASRLERYLRPRRRKGAIPLLTRTVELRRPVGVVGQISPWNYPLVMAASDAIPALLVGNCVIMKPAEETPFITLYAMHLMREAGVPEDVVQVVTGKGRVIGPAMLEGVDYLCFTGGTSTGRILAAQAGERLIKCSMELGGKNPAIVLNDADVDKAATGILRGAFSNAGQLCVHLERVYVQRGIYERFVAELVRRVQAIKLGGALDFSTNMGSLLNQSQLEKVTHHVQDAVRKGATVLTGGRARPDLGPYFFEPTLLTGVTPEMDVYAEETFGPVLSIYAFDDVEEAVQAANALVYGLNASIWTRNICRGREIARQIQAGTVNVNDGFAAAWGSVDAPMGGMKASGLGRRHGEEGILKYTEAQTVAVQRLMPIGPFGRFSVERYVALMTAILKMMRALPPLR